MQWVKHLYAYWKIKRSGQFDEQYYKDQQAKISGYWHDPIWHYVTVGWKKGYNPNESFDTQWYLEANPDVNRLSKTLNPFLHYLRHGLGEARLASGSGDAYPDWITACESYNEKQVVEQIAAYPLHPLISILVPVYQPDLQHFRQCIDSVLNQAYENWELCIADDFSNDEALYNYLDKLASADQRIKVLYRESNGNISASSNSALDLATGEFVALLDQDDRLADYALYELVARINQNPEAKIIYSDEDKLDSNGIRHSPHFKPDWNKYLLYSINYISHLGVFQRNLVIAVGGFRQGYEGSQDYDLVRRCCALVENQNIEHIPKILYHWRVSEGSTAATPESKPYTWEAGIRALSDHIASEHSGVTVARGDIPNTYRVEWPIAEVTPLVSLIIPTRNGGKVFRKCIESILNKTDYPKIEVLVIDNQSTSSKTLSYLEKLDKHDMVRVLSFDEPFNFSRIMNFGVGKAKGDYVGLVNDDIEVISQNWLKEMVGLASRDDVGCVGAKLYYPDGSIQHGGVVLGIQGVAGHAHKYFPKDASGYFGRLKLCQEYSAITAACLLVDKSIYNQVGGFEEENLAIAFNDIDFCLKVRMEGYKNVWTPWAELYHHESLTRGHEDTEEKRARFNSEVKYMIGKWGKNLSSDPAYNPNLTLQREDFGLSVPVDTKCAE